MSSVWVLNTGSETLQDGWDGKRYEFAPNKPVEVPVEAAQHIFGYQLEDKIECFARLGWTKTRNDIPEAIARLEKFQITDHPPRTHHYPSPVVAQVPLPVKRGEGKGTAKVA